MSLISPFSAVLPDQQWYTQLLATGRVGLIKSLLEPRNEVPAESWKLQRHLDALDTLLSAGNYFRAKSAALYVYEHESPAGSQIGVWTHTSMEAIAPRLIPHEQTLSAHLERHKVYREHVGFEGSPVLLTYSGSHQVNQLIEKVTVRPEDVFYCHEGHKHKLWVVSELSIIDAFTLAFEQINKVYVADGHHRLSAAAELHVQAPQWISSLYVAASQLRCREFNRLVLPDLAISKVELMAALGCHFSIRPEPANLPCRPVSPGSFGLNLEGEWYQLNLKDEGGLIGRTPDVSLLQNMVLKPFFGIDDPRGDSRLQSWSANDWEQMIAYADTLPHAVIFTFCPIGTDTFMYLADKGIELPPKSTFIEPKVPYGMLLSAKFVKGYA